ncbi:MAG: type II toxin-antitoxin system RelE/ParE family toxin [Azospirillaceae bacterium]|nr:type II toxin-antitoxin system RelE/ParE family toxin [Azospirillaceae bacterium]
MIQSFVGKIAEGIWTGTLKKGFPADAVRRAEQALYMLSAAPSLESLRSPPGNRLEALSGDRKGQHSIRINDQWRVCFRWQDGHAHDVEIVDYH